MSVGRPMVVVSLPARSLEATRRQIDEAGIAGADMAEVRLDRWSPAERPRVGQLFPASLPLIATLRSRAEGGEGPDAAEDRAATLLTAAREPFAFVDLESGRDRRLEDPVRELGPRVVRSAHLVPETPPMELRARVVEGGPPNGLLKIVLPASLSRAVHELLPLFEGTPAPHPVFLTTGPSGPLWRAWTGRLGIPWVFAALAEEGGAGSVEPSQIPADRLETFLSAPDAPIFAVVGHPVAHSRSPAIHHGWMRRGGHAGLYVPLDLDSPGEFRVAIEALPSRGLLGFNVTHPYKRLAYECAGERSADALATGVANCLTFLEGRVVADNTDLGAVQRRLEELRDQGLWSGSSLTILGGGGAARATLVAAQRLGATATVYARRASEVEALATEYEAEAGDPHSPSPAGLVVHATDVGRAGRGPLELPLRPLLAPGSYLLDWVYDPEVPVLSQIARDQGASYEDGRRLLVYQAAASFRTWWGAAPDDASIAEALQRAGCAA